MYLGNPPIPVFMRIHAVGISLLPLMPAAQAIRIAAAVMVVADVHLPLLPAPQIQDAIMQAPITPVVDPSVGPTNPFS